MGSRNGYVCVTAITFAQTKSAIQFYDSTGDTKTGKVGWSGDATNGYLFLQTPADGELLKAKAGGVEVNGTLSATKVTGDGSGLTNLPVTTPAVGSVTGLQDSLNKKADTTWVKTRLGPKADTSWVTTRIANIGSGQIPDGAVTTAKIADSAVTTAKIKNRAITDAKIDSVDWAKIRNKPTIPSGTIADGSVTTSKIADGAVTDAKIESVPWAKVSGKPARYRTHSDSITWTAGSEGQVWKMGAGGTPGWSADLQGTGGATTISGITGLSDSLTAHRTLINTKADASHNQAISTVNGLADSLTAHRTLINGKANTSHSHAIADVSGLQTALDGKAATSHTHTIANVTNLQTTLDGKAATSHAHTIANVTGLQTALDGKASTSNPTFSGDVKIISAGSLVVYPDSSQPHIIDRRRAITIKNGRISAGITMELVSGGADGEGSEFHLMAGGDASVTNFNFYANGSDYRQGDAVLRLHGKESGGWNHVMELRHDGSQGVIKSLYGDINLVPATGYNVRVNGNIVSTSDVRFKKNIEPLNDCLEKVNNLNGVSYEFRSDEYPEKQFPTSRQIGLIAQDVEAVLPEVVVTDHEGYKSLAYDRLVAVLIEAVKAQQKEIESLKEVVEKLKAR